MQAQLDRIKQARSSLEKVRHKLLQPTAHALESSADDVACAVECLQRVESGLSATGKLGTHASRAIRVEIEGLRRDLQRVNALLEGAGKFYQGWARLMSSAEDTSNYTPDGKTGRPAAGGCKLVIHG